MPMQQLMIETEILRNFKAVCAQKGCSMKSVAEELITEFLAKNESVNPGPLAPTDVCGPTEP